jgi:hypothetical protein
LPQQKARTKKLSFFQHTGAYVAFPQIGKFGRLHTYRVFMASQSQARVQKRGAGHLGDVS